MLERYVAEDALRFHMPGHKGLIDMPGGAFDLTEVPGSDSLFDPSDGIFEAEAEAARRWGAGASFLLVNGSSSGVQSMILWSRTHCDKLLLVRDCHVSAVYACASAGIQPVWLEPHWNAAEQLTQWDEGCFSDISEKAGAALFTTYPDYYGRCVNLEMLKDRLAGPGCALLADSAHGAHFIFSDRLPKDAGFFADLWVAGAHKTLPAPTQSAFLHVKDGANASEVSRLLRSVTTTSPSYLLLAGLDNGRAFMETCGGALEELIDGCMELAERLNGLEGLRCWTEKEALGMGYRAFDPTRIVVDVRGLGMSGWAAGLRLRELGVQVEMCDIYRVVLIATVMDGSERLDRLFEAFLGLTAYQRKPAFSRALPALPARGETAMTLRQAWLSATEEIGMESAAGRAAAEPFGAYPPGIPLCVPGEVITYEMIQMVKEVQALGGKYIGVKNGRVRVVR